jgi:hypothetical protein
MRKDLWQTKFIYLDSEPPLLVQSSEVSVFLSCCTEMFSKVVFV